MLVYRGKKISDLSAIHTGVLNIRYCFFFGGGDPALHIFTNLFNWLSFLKFTKGDFSWKQANC